MLKLAIVGFAVFAALGWWLQSSHDRAPGPQTPASNPAPSLDCQPGQLRFRGIALQLSTGWQAQETFGPAIEEIAATGADTLLLSTAGYMEHARAQGIYIDVRRTPDRSETIALIRKARSLGLDVIVMPIILLSHPRGSEWRGVIEPPDWAEWWEQYREFIGYFADVARAGDATALMVGSELVSTERQGDEWRKTVAHVRERFHGLLGYSANWDHYDPVQIWDQLDFVGMTSYYTLADAANPSVDQIVAKWRPIVERVSAWQKTVNKPIVLTEVGWCSQEGAATAPWNYYHAPRATPAGMEEQRRLYEAFIAAWNDAPAIAGVIWWEWGSGPGGVGDCGYTPKGKPAERLLREWLRETAPASQPTSAPRQPRAAPE